MNGSEALHVAIIMDGNGRWAAKRGLPRIAGHRRGADAVRRTVEAAPALGITTLTLFAFSSDNWKRPPAEVRALMRLFRQYLDVEVSRLIENEVRLSIIGRRDRLSSPLVLAIRAAEAATVGARRLHLRVAIDYSARDAIVRAARRLEAVDEPSREAFAARLGEAYGGSDAPDVDLLIRTGGERRLSDFLLWESAYAELYFTPRMWPDFDGDDLAAAVAEFHTRQRRFGGLSIGGRPPAPVVPVTRD
jgi:undecaprenyl diphosphate synthase